MMPPTMPPHRLQAQENPYCGLKNYEIEKKIGRGQFSVVFRARCKHGGQIVALKKIQVYGDVGTVLRLLYILSASQYQDYV
jgi:hypothetical protein